MLFGASNQLLDVRLDERRPHVAERRRRPRCASRPARTASRRPPPAATREYLAFLVAPTCGDQLTPYLVVDVAGVRQLAAGRRVTRVAPPTWQYGFDDAPSLAIDAAQRTRSISRGREASARRPRPIVVSSSDDGGAHVVARRSSSRRRRTSRICRRSRSARTATCTSPASMRGTASGSRARPTGARRSARRARAARAARQPVVELRGTGDVHAARRPRRRRASAPTRPSSRRRAASTSSTTTSARTARPTSTSPRSTARSGRASARRSTRRTTARRSSSSRRPRSTRRTGALWACWYDTTFDPHAHRAWFTCSASHDGRTWTPPERAAADPTKVADLFTDLRTSTGFSTGGRRRSRRRARRSGSTSVSVDFAQDIYTAALSERAAFLTLRR